MVVETLLSKPAPSHKIIPTQLLNNVDVVTVSALKS